MAILNCNIPASLLLAVDARANGAPGGVPHLVVVALSQYLGEPIHTLSQVSTSGALVAGLYSGGAVILVASSVGERDLRLRGAQVQPDIVTRY